MSTPQLYQAMGDTTKQVRYADATVYDFGVARVWILDADQKVHRIDAKSPAYVTPEGLHVRDSELAAKAKYPTANWKTGQEDVASFCDPRGMLVATQEGKVIGISVWSPGC